MNFVSPLGKTRIKLKGKVGVPGGQGLGIWDLIKTFD